jgi:argininosuccinate lyase
LDTLRVFADMVAGIQVNREGMRAAAQEGYATATDLADYLVKKGLPFRDAHEAVALAVRAAAQSGKDLSDLPLTELQSFSALISEDVFEVLKVEGSVAARDHIGGTAPNQVRQQIRRHRG